jgi:DNA-binding transcriptional LysR family regulator
VTEAPPALRIAFAPGVTVGKWTRRWQERHPELPLEVFPAAEDEGVAVLSEGRATLSFVRLPVEREGLSVIRLYSEISVLVVPRDSELAELESVADERVVALAGVVAYSPTKSVKDAVALVGAGVGFLRLPHSLARLYARKDVVAIPIDGAAETEVAICWRQDETTELVDEFVGIVRGRTEASSRANPTPPTPRVRPAKVVKKRAPKTPQKPPRRTGGKTKKRGSR